jgi:hypothetical protein
MATDLDIKVKVDSSQLDQVGQKVGELRDLGRGLKIQYDIDGKPIDIAIDKSLNLQKQVKVLTAELRRTKEGTAEFQLLSTKLGDAQDQLSKTTAKSKDLFSSLSMIPGPVGQFFSQLQGGIELMKTFSSFTFKDLQFQFKETANDIGDIAKNLGTIDTTNIDNIKDSTDEANQSFRDAVSDSADLARTQSVIASKRLNEYETEVAAIKNLEAAQKKGNVAKDYQIGLIQDEVTKRGLVPGVIKQTIDAEGKLTETTRALTQSEVQLAAANKNVTVTTEGMVVAEKAATFWTTTLGTTIKTVLISTGILAAIVVIGELVALIYRWVTSSEDAEAATRSLTGAIEEQQRVLQNDLEAIDMANKANVTRAKIAGETEEQISKRTIKGGEERLKALREYDDQLFKLQDDLSKNEKIKGEEKLKLAKDINDRILKNGQDITKQILTNEQVRLDEELRLTDKRRQQQKTAGDKINSDAKQREQKKLEDKKAADQLYLDLIRENAKQAQTTEREKELFALEFQRQSEKNKINELKISTERKNQIISQIDIKYEDLAKAINKKYDDDDKKRDEELAKRKKDAANNLLEISIKSIRDEVVRSRVERLKQFNDEKEKLDQSLKDGLITREKYNEAILNMQKAFANDIAKINSDARIKELEATKAVDESRLRIFQMNMDQSNATRLWYLNDFFAQQLKVEEDNFLIEKERNKNNAKELLRIDAEHANNVAAIKEAERQQKLQIYNQGLDDLAGIFAAESDLQKGAIILKQTLLAIELGMEIKKAVASAKLTAAKAKLDLASGVAATAKIGFPQNIIPIALYAIQAAAIISTILTAAKGIGPSAQGPAAPPPMGANYGDGGIIEGPSHSSAAGGTIINAEGGEAVMTKGAVTMFRPLLSMMNQAGGGTAFGGGVVGQGPYDNPDTADKSMEPQIIKTYIVERDLTSIQERQARLKSLSTL